MAPGAVPPGSLNLRYDEVSGGPEQRTLYYLAKRYLGLDEDEWEDLPWYKQRYYIDGFQQEQLIKEGTRDDDGGGSDNLVTGSMDSLRNSGFSTG